MTVLGGNRRPRPRLAFLRALAVAAAVVAVLGGTVPAPGGPGQAGPAGAAPTEAADEHSHDGATGEGDPTGHDSEGLRLVSIEGPEQVRPGPGCPAGAPDRRYDIAAINVDITLNRYLDHDPLGRMYVLEEELARVRAEEAQNAAARATGSEPAVTPGLQGDAIQPLVIRVNQGECLRVRLRNGLTDGETASFHLHGSAMRVAATGESANSTSAGAVVQPGATTEFEWMVGPEEQEGTFYFHSEGGDTRLQTSHGLFGGVIVEPAGSVHLDPVGGRPLRSGWSAIIEDPAGSDFREFAIAYHEIGDENYQLLNRSDELVPLVDPLSGAYRPGSRAINYRSEPFMNRLALQQERTGSYDESLAYSSYSFGDPATPVARTYLGDPVKQRVIHGGSEVAHVHHVHGGAVRWRRQPGVEPTGFDQGLVKRPPLRPAASERVDSQAISPSETFDVESECGSGGCQQSAGDFLFHCHVAHHYFAGMWGITRVYNTLQDGRASTDSLPPLTELPDRSSQVEPAVPTTELAGRTVDWSGRTFSITEADLPAWMARQLPPPGVPRGYDASVLDWTAEAGLYLGEPEADSPWPGYQPRAPGTRPPITVDPQTGKLAYPFLRPHLGKRPPFAPNHNPAPFLDPVPGTDPARPGDSGPASLCPTGTRPKKIALQAISVPVTINAGQNLVDPQGALFVLKSQEDAVRAGGGQRVPLAVRANAGEDCVDVLLRSELDLRTAANARSKVSTHIHFVQFDVQGSDGINTGFNYEQTVLPFADAGETVRAAAPAGTTSLVLGATDRFQPGVVVGVGMDQDETFEVRRIVEVRGSTVVLDQPLAFAHASGEVVSTEFVRYRWYPDAQTGTAYFHDHVNGLSSWRHGLYGALIVEPPGSTYHDPRTGAQIESGPLADIRTGAPVSADVTGSFREFVAFIQDDNPITAIGRSPGSSINLRAEPLDDRTGGDPSRRFSSADSGDPETPIVEANLGDPLVMRTLVGGTNEVHTWHVDGHWFRAERWSATSTPIDTVRLGISERYDLVIPRAGGPQQMPGDYLYYNGRSVKLREGSWGIIRVREGNPPGLQPLPGRPPVAAAPAVCPPGAPSRRFAVAAVDVPLPMLGAGEVGKIYVLQADKAAVLTGARAPEPLVLHANVGDCILVDLTNETVGGPVSFHAGMLASDPRDSGGVTAGTNPAQAVAPGQTRTSTFYASPEVGETTALVRDYGDVLVNPRLGLYGAIVVGPAGSRYFDPVTGADLGNGSSWKVDVVPPESAAYRDFSVLMQDEDDGLATHRMPYSSAPRGVVGLNYRNAPAVGGRIDTTGGPSTPVMEAFAGDPVRVNVLAPWSEQAQAFSIEGHRWPFEPGRAGTDMLSTVTLGGMEAISARLDGGAGGVEAVPGDYVYGNHRLPFREAGQWGLLRVRAPGAGGPLRALPGACATCGGGGSGGSGYLGFAGGLTALLLVGMVGAGAAKRRRDGRVAAG